MYVPVRQETFRTPKSGRAVRRRYDAVRQILQVFHGSYTLLFGMPDEPIKVSILQKSNLFPAKQNQTHQESTLLSWTDNYILQL